MSAIGDYVHYRALNYIKYGTSIKGVYSKYENQKQKIRTQFKRQITLSKKDSDVWAVQALANDLLEMGNKQFFNPTQISTETYYKMFKMLFANVVDTLFWDSEFSNIGDLTALSLDFRRSAPDLKYLQDIKNINETIAYLRKLNGLLLQEYASGIVEAEEFLKIGINFVKELYMIQRELTEFNQKSELAKGKGLQGLENRTGKRLGAINKNIHMHWDELSQYMEAILEMSAESVNMPMVYAKDVGTLEHATKLLPAMIENNVKDMLTKATEGILEETNIKQKVRENKIKYSQEMQNITLQTIADDDNLVFNLQWKQNNFTRFRFQTTDAFEDNKLFSGKGYQTELDLLAMLESYTSIDYINHFLNIFATHLGTVPKRIRDYRKDMLEELHIIALYALMQSNNFNILKKDKHIDIIFFKDPKTKKVQAKSIYTILEEIYNNTDLVEVSMNNKPINNSFKLFSNRYWGDRQVPSYSDAWRRIVGLLADARQRKLSVALKI